MRHLILFVFPVLALAPTGAAQAEPVLIRQAPEFIGEPSSGRKEPAPGKLGGYFEWAEQLSPGSASWR